MHFPYLRVPARIAEHPIESVVAGLLLLALLFGSADPQSRADAHAQPVSQHLPQKM